MSNKIMEYYLNGKRVKYVEIRKRKAKLQAIFVITEKWYDAPLTKEEKKQKEEEKKANDEFFRNMREQREWRDQYHG